MIFFGHLGLAAGAVKLGEKVWPRLKKKAPADIDYRILLAGAVLPDILDKPIGAFLFVNTYHNSRIYAHTLVFSAVLLLIGALLYHKRKTNAGLVLWLGSFIHLLFDSPWRYPETLLWPFWNIEAALSAGKSWLQALLGFPYMFDDWIKRDVDLILKNPTPLLFELAGGLVLVYFLVRLVKTNTLREFFKKGKLSTGETRHVRRTDGG